MAERPFDKDDLDGVENIFDVFLLLFAWLKKREGQVLSGKAGFRLGFEVARRDMHTLCQRLSHQDQEFADRGELTTAAKRELSSLLLGMTADAAADGLYGALVAIDQAFAPKSIQPTAEPLNRRFRDRGHVRYLPQNRLPYGDRKLVRGYATVGSRLENKLSSLTVCLSPSSDYSVEVVDVDEYVRALFEDRPSPRFGLAPFRAPSERPHILVTHAIPDESPLFRAAGADDSAASARLTALLDMAVRGEVDVLVFPELSFTPALLAQLQDELEHRHRRAPIVKLVIAGTLNDGEQNVCHVLGPDGALLWQQPKMNRFVIERGELRNAPDPIPEQGGVEDIDISDRRIRVADLPFGRVAVLVCLDFILPETHALLANMQVNCIFVPAMTPQRERFETLAWAHAAASEATTFFCNAPNSPEFGPEARSFVYTPEKSAKPQSIDGSEPWEHSMLVFSAQPRVVETLRIENP